MLKRQLMLKTILLVVFLMSFSSALMLGYAYWDNKINTQASTLNIGDWGIAISTPKEFNDLANKSNGQMTDRYYLINDIDFSEHNWTYVDGGIFRGTLDGNGKTLSNLTVYHNSSSFNYIGIFPKMQGGSVYNLKLSNVYLDLGNTALGGKRVRAGLIAGSVDGQTNIISNITIENAGVRGTSTNGAGGLIGNITTSTTVVNIDNIKATNLKVFNKSSYSGGIIGVIGTNGAKVTINDIDIQGEVYSYNTSSYTGGIIGRIASGGKFSVNRAIVEMTSRNTLETNSTYNLKYSNRYLGGFIGRNQSTSANVVLNNVFFTGSLYTNTRQNRGYIGTAIGTTGGSINISNDYYANVTFRANNGSFITDPDTTTYGVFAELVSETSLPTIPWWNGFSINFDSANSLWAQDGNGRLYLIRN